MNKIISIKLPILALAMVFTISCSSDSEDSGKNPVQGGENSSSSNEQSSSSSSVQSSSSVVAPPSSSSSSVQSSSSVVAPPSSSSSSVQSSSSGIDCTINSLHASGCITGEILLDARDGEIYEYVEIGTQTWMAENMNYNVPGSKCGGTDKEIDEDGDEYYPLKDENTANCTKYGRLYDWATAMALPSKCNSTLSTSSADCAIKNPNHQGICPSGWHIPSTEEWDVLVDYYDYAGDFPSKAGTKLKATSGWNTGSGYKAGTNEHGFSALPGGYGNPVGDFSNVGYKGYWWSASEVNDGDAYGRDIYYDSESVYYSMGDKGFLYSVRCIKDN